MIQLFAVTLLYVICAQRFDTSSLSEEPERGYSCRKVSMGSMRAARRAGT
jgi:hypothetical protein